MRPLPLPSIWSTDTTSSYGEVPGRTPRCRKTDETIHSLVRNSDAAARYGNGEMCEKCVEIDAKIERYRNIVRSIADQPTVDGTKALIADLEAQKAVLHPQREQ
jgi:hypothetical protein